MTEDGFDFSGNWRSTYWYPSNERVGDDPSTYRMTAHQDGKDVVFESEPNDEGSYMLIRLHIRDNLAIGSWFETTSPYKSFKGAEYSGSGQLLIDEQTGNMTGKWAGAGLDQKLKEMRIYTGNWEIVRELERK